MEDSLQGHSSHKRKRYHNNDYGYCIGIRSSHCVFFGAGGIGFVFGYAVKKVAKILAVIVGLLFMGLAYMDYNGWVKVNWQAVSNSTNAAVQNGLNQTIAIMNRTAIEVQHHATVAHSGVNEIGLFPIVGATGLIGGLIYGLQKG